jgi:hypothetical protein
MSLKPTFFESKLRKRIAIALLIAYISYLVLKFEYGWLFLPFVINTLFMIFNKKYRFWQKRWTKFAYIHRFPMRPVFEQPMRNSSPNPCSHVEELISRPSEIWDINRPGPHRTLVRGF